VNSHIPSINPNPLLRSHELGFDSFNRENGGCMHVQSESINLHYMVLKTRKQQPEWYNMIFNWKFSGLLKCDAAWFDMYTLVTTHLIHCQISEDLNLLHKCYENLISLFYQAGCVKVQKLVSGVYIYPFPQGKAIFYVLWYCMLYIHHKNSKSLNPAAGVMPHNMINYSCTISSLDILPYFPQQKELQHTITNFNQRFLNRCENKTHKKEDMTCQSHTVCTVHCAKKA